jgi:hypothetical protein
MIYTDNQLVHLAQNNPKELVRLLNNPHTTTKMLVVGIEILSLEVLDESLVLPILRLFTKHINASVRESACIGIATFYERKTLPTDLVDRLKIMSTTDPSPSIKEITKEILNNLA